VVLVGIILTATSVGAAPLRVVTTTSDLAALARAVGGEEVKVVSLARGDQDPHYVPAKPSLSRKLSDGDLLVYVGLELEIGWLPLLVQASRNPKVQSGRPGSLAASQGIDILEVPQGEVSRAEGDVHPEGNPHYWLDPRNGRVIARVIAERLGELRPGSRSTFTANLQAFEDELDRRLAGWEEHLAPLRGVAVVADHKQWEYLAGWAGFRLVDYIEPRPGIPPGPRHLLRLAERMKEEKVVAVIYADFWSPNTAEETADRGGTTAVRLPASVGSRPGIDSYFDLFDVLVGELAGVVSRD
jgi:zinc/manganese transport system substrate-binding protein